MFVYNFFILILLILVLVKIYNVLKSRWCTSKVCLNGKTVIVTGSNTGIGYETALEFAKRGARVIMGCRDLEKAGTARDKIVAATKNKNVVVHELNLASLHSVKNFVKNIKKNEERLDILVNNAGSGVLKNKFTDDGLQILMQINYFGAFLLTILLLDLMKKTESSRIINVSSILAQKSNLTVDNLNKWPGTPLKSYANSKLGNILFTQKLAEFLKGSSVTTYSVHPGAIATDIFRRIKGWVKVVINLCMMLYFKTPEEGAQTTLYTALQQGIEKYSGQHFEECQRIDAYRSARDPAFADKIWNETVKLLKCEKEVEQIFH